MQFVSRFTCYVNDESGCEVYPHNCDECGFNNKVDAVRKSLPLMLCTDGLQRKILAREKNDE